MGHAGDGLLSLAGDASGFTVAIDNRHSLLGYLELAGQVDRQEWRGAGGPAGERSASSQPTLYAVTDSALVVLVIGAVREGLPRQSQHPKDANAADTSLATASNMLALQTHGEECLLDRGGQRDACCPPPPGAAIPWQSQASRSSSTPAPSRSTRTHVYWASRHHGRVYRAARDRHPGGHRRRARFSRRRSRTSAIRWNSGIGRIAIDGTSVYVSDSRSIFKTRK